MRLLKASRSMRLIVLLAALALVLAACPAAAPAQPGAAPAAQEAAPAAEAPAAAAPADSGEKVLNILYWQAASLPNNHLSGGTKDHDAAAITLEPLANITPEGDLFPKLAVEIPTVENGGVSEDLTSITWKLKEGVKWSDGSPFTAADVLFTYAYCSEEATGCVNIEQFDGVTNIEALDDYTVQITFDNPTPYPYQAFVGSPGHIINATQFSDCIGTAAQT